MLFYGSVDEGLAWLKWLAKNPWTAPERGDGDEPDDDTP